MTLELVLGCAVSFLLGYAVVMTVQRLRAAKMVALREAKMAALGGVLDRRLAAWQEDREGLRQQIAAAESEMARVMDAHDAALLKCQRLSVTNAALRQELAEAQSQLVAASVAPPVVDVMLPTDMTGEDAALLLGVTTRTVQRWAKEGGKIPVRGVLRRSGAFVYDAAAVKVLAASRSWVCADAAAVAVTFGESPATSCLTFGEPSGRAEDAQDG